MRTDLLPATVVLVLPVFALAIQDQLDTAANYPPQVPSGEEIDLNKRGYGSLCEKDDDCFIGRGLACVGSRCNCSTKNPLRIRDSTGIPTCLKAKAIYEACTYDEECVRGSENLKCVDYLCYCSLPFILRDDMQCVAARPPMLRTLVAVVPTVFLLFIIFILGGTYIYQRLFHHQEPGVRREPSGEPESQQGSAEAVAKRSYTGSNAIKLQNTNLSGIYRQFLRSAQASHSRESVSAASRPTPGFLATPKAVRDQPRGASFSPTYFRDVISSSTEEDLTEVKVCRGDAENPPGADDPIPLMLAKKILGASLLNSITSSEEVVVKVETKAKEAVDKSADKAEKRPKKVEEKRRQSESKKGAVEVTQTEKFSCVLDKGTEHRSQHVGDVSPPTKLSRAAPPPQADEPKKTTTVRRLPSSDLQRDHVEPELYEGTQADLTMTPTLPLREKNTLGIGTPFVDTEDPLPESESVGLSFLSLASSHEVLPKPDIQSKSFRARLSEENRVHQGSHSLDDGKLRFCRFSPLDVEFDLNLLPSLSNDPYSAEHYLEVVHEEEIADGQSTENVREVDPVTAQSSVRTAPQLPTENRGGTTEGRTVGGATDKNGSCDPIQTATAPVNVAEQETVAEKSAGTGRKSSKVISAKTVKPETAREPEVLVPDIGNKAKQTILPESPSCPSKPEIPTVKDSEKRRGPLRSSASGVEQQDDVRRLLRLTSPLADGGGVKREDSASRRTGRRGAVVQLPTMATVDEESTQRPECSSKIERNLGAVQDVRTRARKSPEPPESLDSAKGKSSKTPVTAKTTLSSAQTAVPDKDFRRNVGNARGQQKPLRQQKSLLRAGPFRLTGSISRLPKVEEGHPLTSIEQDDVRPDVHTSRILLGSRISNPSVDAGVGRASSLSLRRFSPMPVSPTTSAKGRAGRPGSRRLLRSSSTALNKSSLKLARSRRDIAATFGEAIQALKRKSSKPLKEEVDTGASDHVPSSSTTQRTERKSDKTDADEDLAKEIQDAVRTGSTSSGSHDITEALTKIKVAMMGNEHYRRERNVLQRPSARATPSENRPSIPTGVALNETQYILQYDINFRRQQRRSSEAICTRSPSPTRNCRPVPGVEFSPRPSTPPSEVFVSKNMAGVCDVSPSFIKSLLDQELIQVSPLPLKEIIRLRYPHMTPIIARKKNASSSKTTSKHQRSSILATLNEASTSHTNPDSVSCSEFLEQGEVYGKPIPKPRSTSHRMEEKTDEPRPVPRKRNVTSKRANRGRLHLITGNVLDVGPHPVAAFVQPLHLSPKDSFTTIGDTSSTKASRQAKRQKQRRLTAGDSAVERNGDLEVLYDAAITRAEAVGLRSSINSTNLHDETPRTQAAPYNDVVSRRQDVNDSRPNSRTRRRLHPSRHPRRYSSEPHRSSGTITLAAKKQFSEPLRGQLAIIPEVTNEASPTPSTESSYDAISSLDDPSSDSDNTRSSYSTPPRHKPKQPDITLCRKTTNMDNVPKKPKPYSITPTSSAFFTSDTSSYLGASCVPSSLRGKLSDVEVCVRSSVMEGTTTEGVLSIDLGRTTLVNDPSRASSFRKKTMKKIGSRVRDLRRVFEDSSRDVTQKCSSIRDKFGIVSARVNQWRTSKSHPQRDVAPMLVTESHRPLQVQEVEEQVTTFHQMMKALQKSSTSVIAAIGGSSVPSRTASPRSSPSHLHESASREWKEPAVEPEPDSSLESFPGHNEPPGRREHLKEKVIAEMGLSDWQRKPLPRTRTKRAPSPRLLSYAVWPGREQPDSSTSFSVLEASDVDSLFAVTSMEGGSKPYQCFGMTASSTSNVPVSRSLHIDTSESEWYSCSDTEHDA
ncbi:uncharacterized protein LOC135387840 [Ornithodoros turicata]|uniref:uncharacterized protein LOC135387840 n=1 Tax=Ornithodoros turicata TaxID=34597 RepID=UPI0031392971